MRYPSVGFSIKSTKRKWGLLKIITWYWNFTVYSNEYIKKIPCVHHNVNLRNWIPAISPNEQSIPEAIWVAFQKHKLVNLGALKFSLVNKLHIFQCMGKIFCVEFQSFPLKSHTKHLTHTLKETIFIQYWKWRSSQIYALGNVFEMPPRSII